MASKGFWAGWVTFAALLIMIIGGLDLLMGLTAVIRDEYYVLTPQGALVIDVSDWGWVMIAWGAILGCIGLGLFSGAGWARWVAIVGVTLNFIAQLGFQGNNVTLWGLVVVALNILVLYALIVRWGDAKSELR